MSGMVIVIALALLMFYAWGTAAFWQAASRARVKLLYLIAYWNLLAALSSLVFLLSDGFLSLLGIVFAAITPVLWSLGRVGKRLRQYGFSFSQIYSFGR